RADDLLLERGERTGQRRRRLVERRRAVRVLELRRAREDDRLRAERDAVAMAEREAHAGLRARAVEEGAVEAAPVLDEPAAVGARDDGVVPADGRRRQAEIALRGPADHEVRVQLALAAVGEDERRRGGH